MGKKVTQNIEPSARPRIEPGTSGLRSRDLTAAPTPPPIVQFSDRRATFKKVCALGGGVGGVGAD